MTEKTLSKAAIQREREALQKRLADLDAAERVLDGWWPGAVVNEPESAAGVLGAPFTIKNVILREAGRPNGVSTAEVAAIISDFKGGPYPATNVSPKLSLYGSDGLLRSENGRWFRTEKGTKELENSKN